MQMSIPPEVQNVLVRQQYRLVGAHSAVKICHWTRESLIRGRVCFKELWYPPVESHRCMQMTPVLGCNFHCLYCWRLHSGDRAGLIWKEFPLEMVDEPGEIVRAAIEARRLLLSGFGGHPEVNKDKFVEALTPTMMTMSLVGEPTLYPRLGELIGEARRAHMRCFLVTNGTTAQALAELDPLPWQLYVTLPAPDEATYRRVCRPLIPDGWQRIEETLELLPSLGCRRVIRLTLVRGLNLKAPTTYARLIERADPDFCEVKAFTWVGEARRRLRQANVPSMEEVYQFAHELAKMTGFTLADKHIPSRVVLLINR